MRFYLLIMVFSLFSCKTKTSTEEISPAALFAGGKWIDLTYSFSSETLYWPTADRFRFDTVFKGTTPAGFYYEAYNFCAAEHGGTHLDAPVHFAKGKWATDEIPADRLTGEAVVIDVADSALKNPDYQIRIADIASWEETHGMIPKNAYVFFRTGYGRFYPDALKYLGTDERGTSAVAKLHFPGIHPDAAAWIVANREIKAVGLDVASVDYGQSTGFETHRILYEKNILGFENLAHLDKLPATGAFIMALPMKIKQGSGGPLRVLAWIQKSPGQ